MEPSTSSEKSFKDMTMAELKIYLRERGVTVNGYLKHALIEIAIAVDKMMLPIDPNFEKDARTVVDDKFIYVNDMEIEDPFSASHQLQNNFIDCPSFGLYDIFNYLIYHSAEYDKQGLAAYKSFDDYRLFQDGYVESLLTKPLQNEGLHLFVSKVRPAMKQTTDGGKRFYDLWFILEGKGVNRGTVLKARRVCKGGRDGGCKHIAAAMYSLEDLLNTRGEDSVTSGACQWIKRPTTDSDPCDVKDLKISKSVRPLNRKRKNEHVYCEHIEADVRYAKDRYPASNQSVKSFTESLFQAKKRPAILPLLAKLYDVSEPRREAEPVDLTLLDKPEDFSPLSSSTKQEFTSAELEQGIMKANLLRFQGDKWLAIEKDLHHLCLDKAMVDKIEKLTKKQWQCKEWHQQKAGFITASKAKRVFTLQTSIDKDLPRNVTKIVEEIVYPKIPSSFSSPPENPQNPRHWGLRHEDSARHAYVSIESKKHHKLKITQKGFLISRKKPFVGASLDNVRTCGCNENCPEVVVEYKCPWKHRHLSAKEAFLSPEVGGQKIRNYYSLKSQSQYYFQIQLQMFVSGLTSCDFVVWTTKGVFSVDVPSDESFLETVIEKLQRFWLSHVLPSMMQELLSKKGTAKTGAKDSNNFLVEETAEAGAKDSESNDADTHVDIVYPDNQTTECQMSIKVSGIDIYQACIDGLLPKAMVNDQIVILLLSELCCQFPIVSSFFYTVLCGEQETNKKFSRYQRNERAGMFFKPELLEEDYIFFPINRSHHWLLAAITPWHILIMDSLTQDLSTRRTEISIIFSYLQHLCTKFGSPKRHLSLTYRILTVPQQAVGSNNCGIYISMFLKHFLQDLDDYEKDAEGYCTMEHTWFGEGDAEKKRTETRSYLQTLFLMEKYSNK